jgi:oligopeptide/dipeptide ABC transporter ATP-binding protein
MSEKDGATAGNLIDVVHLKKYFPIRAGLMKRVVGNVRAVDEVDFYIKKGETLGLVGESGCGKTTVGRSIMMLTPPSDGFVLLEAPREVVVDFRKLVDLQRSADSSSMKKQIALEMATLIDKFLNQPSCQIKEDKKKHICAEARKYRDQIKKGTVSDPVPDARRDEILALADDALREVCRRYCINHLKKKEVRRIRGRIQFVFQDPFSSLDPRMLVKDIVAEPIRAQMKLWITRWTIRLRVMLFLSVSLLSVAITAWYWNLIFTMMNTPPPLDISLIYRIELLVPLAGMGASVYGSLRLLNSTIDRYASQKKEVTVGGNNETTRRVKAGERVRNEIIKLMETVGLNVEHLYRYPHEFSGGQRQRIGIARALSVRPDFVVLDEPTSALDVSVQAQILNMLNDLQRDFGLTYLFISHDLSTIRYMCDRVAVMYLGKIAETAPKAELFNHPTHPYTEALLSVIPVPDPDIRKNRIILSGDVPSPANPPSGCRFHTRCPLAIPICSVDEPELVDYGNEHFVACHVRKEVVK